MSVKQPSDGLPDSLPDSLKVKQAGNLYFVSVDRPAKRNALNDEIFTGLGQVFSNIPDDVGAVVITGEGDHFSAGLDLTELRELDAFEGVDHSRTWHRVLDDIQFGPVPVLAVLQGAVVGGGLELATAAHIRIAEPSAFFALPEGQRGIFVGGGASVNVERLIGTSRMMDMMLTGRVIKAEEGEAIGLVQYLVGEGEGITKAVELATKIASNAPASNYAVTHILPRIAEMSREQGLQVEALIASITQSTPDAKRRMQDFLDKKAGKVGE